MFQIQKMRMVLEIYHHIFFATCSSLFSLFRGNLLQTLKKMCKIQMFFSRYMGLDVVRFKRFVYLCLTNSETL